MKNPFVNALREDNLNTREDLFGGDIFLIDGGNASQALVSNVIDDMQSELQTADIRKAHKLYSDSELFQRFGTLRRHFYESPEYHNQLRDVVAECGFEPDRVAFDPIRIRVVLPGGHRNPKAAPVYYPHRDTWYAHPESLIVWWIPLHDLRANETFEFFLNHFEKEVPNNSEIFDYSDWIKDGPALKIGWQKEDSGEQGGYPSAALDTCDLAGVGFECAAAANLIFAGSHFHQTLAQDFDTIRYSLDFRVVHLDDVASGKGAPNCDNRSSGSTLKDYIHPIITNHGG